jgi:hypothetical protein
VLFVRTKGCISLWTRSRRKPAYKDYSAGSSTGSGSSGSGTLNTSLFSSSSPPTG